MRYTSTRGGAPDLIFDDILLTGLARDGGLYVPKWWPRYTEAEIGAMAGLSYTELAVRIMEPFMEGAEARETLSAVIEDSYAGFGHPAVAPLKQLGDGLWLMELFHGPTLAFKDYAMQVLGRLFDHALQRCGERVAILGATSGDTGSAAIEACRGRAAMDIFILFPKGRVSPVQQRQMTTVNEPNVHAIAIDGTFDDCQERVKELFNDLEFRDRYRLSAVNSINWARILPQVVYFFRAALALGAPARRVAFSVPSGNFGNVFSAYAAAALGLPIEMLIVATNSNDILSRFFESGTMEVRRVEPTLSPSMDIQVSSNFERLLFDLHERDAVQTRQTLAAFGKTGRFTVSDRMLACARRQFSAFRVSDADTLRRIGSVRATTGETVDPHSAVGIEAAIRARQAGLLEPSTPVVSLACAHPAKFPDAVAEATGFRPALPGRFADLMEREERVVALANDRKAIAGYMADHVGAGVSLP